MIYFNILENYFWITQNALPRMEYFRSFGNLRIIFKSFLEFSGVLGVFRRFEEFQEFLETFSE
jgi:hypothetical protein